MAVSRPMGPGQRGEATHQTRDDQSRLCQAADATLRPDSSLACRCHRRLRWMIQSTGGEWTVEDLDATGRLYQLPFYPEAHPSNRSSTHPGTTLWPPTLRAN